MIGIPDQPVLIGNIGIVARPILPFFASGRHERIVFLRPAGRIQKIRVQISGQQPHHVGAVHGGAGKGKEDPVLSHEREGAFIHKGVVVCPAIFRHGQKDRIRGQPPGLVRIDLRDIQPGSLVHRMELTLRPGHIIFPSQLPFRHIQRDPPLIIQRASVLFYHPYRHLPIGRLHGIPVFLQRHHVALLLLKFLRRPRMEDIQPVFDDMEFRRPEKISQMGIHGGIQDQGFLCRHQARNGIRLPDIEGVVVVIIIGGDEIVFPFPPSDAGIRPVPCHRELITVLVDPSRDCKGPRV